MTKKLDTLLAAQKKISEQIRLARAGETDKKRREETRRLILQGRAVERMAAANPNLRTALFHELHRFLDKPIDRELFGLPPRSQDPGNPSAEESLSENPQG